MSSLLTTPIFHVVAIYYGLVQVGIHRNVSEWEEGAGTRVGRITRGKKGRCNAVEFAAAGWNREQRQQEIPQPHAVPAHKYDGLMIIRQIDYINAISVLMSTLYISVGSEVSPTVNHQDNLHFLKAGTT
jgi:hypothetical protein